MEKKGTRVPTPLGELFCLLNPSGLVLLGVLCILGTAYAMSNNRKAINIDLSYRG